MQALVSIVLPVYNGEKYLALAIESILAQTYSNFELILVNDCSTDSTEEIIKEYASKDERIVYLKNERNLKLPASLNRGFSAAKGRYFTWTSDDNLYMPTAIERMAQFLDQHPEAALVYCDYDEVDEDGALIRQRVVEEPDKILYRNVVGACFLYRREAAEVAGAYDTSRFLVEDYEYWLRIYLSFSIAALHECFYQYRWHKGSLTSTRKAEVQAAVDKLHLDYLPIFEKKHLRKELLFPYFEYLFRSKLISTQCRKQKLMFSLRHPSYFLELLRRKKGKLVNFRQK